jgi:hypothetical protein
MELAIKLKIRPEEPLFIIDLPEGLADIFSHFTIKSRLPAKECIAQLIFFARDKKALDAKAPSILSLMKDDGLLWIAYPKKSGSIQSDLIRDEGWQTMFRSDWEGVASVSITNDWSGMRFRSKVATKGIKRLAPVAERKVEGIDFEERTVVLPEDAVKAMKPHKGLEEFFYSMSFTHKKEYVEAIVEAKKSETRRRRIEKTIEAVLELKTKREAKQKK